MKKVLVLDDNPRNNGLFTDPLAKYYEVEVLMAVSAVRRVMSHKKYDLVVIDVMMPTQDTGASSELTTGLYFYKKSIVEQYPQQKVLFWSNRSQEPFNQFFSDGVPANVSFLRKDKNNPQQLLDEVTKLIGR